VVRTGAWSDGTGLFQTGQPRAELCPSTDAQGGVCVDVGLSNASPEHLVTP